MTLHTQLVRLRDEGPQERTLGICHNILDIKAFMAIAKHWPKHSGFFAFPVPDPDPDGDPVRAFMSAHDMWDPDDPYGALRIELLNFVIGELE